MEQISQVSYIVVLSTVSVDGADGLRADKRHTDGFAILLSCIN